MNYYNYEYMPPKNNYGFSTNYGNNPNYGVGDRQLIFPFLTGALVGGAAVGLTRPRPIYNVAPNYGYPGYPYNYGAPYSYYSYGGYIPRPY